MLAIGKTRSQLKRYRYGKEKGDLKVKKIQVVVTEDTFKALSKKLLDEGISKQQFLENQIQEYLGGEDMKNLENKKYGELNEAQKEEVLNMICSIYDGIEVDQNGTDVTFDLENGLSVAGKIIDNDEEVVYEIDDEAVIYNPKA